MENNQIKLLSELAKHIGSKKKTREQVVVSLTSAKILTKKENLTNNFSNLKKVVTTIK